MRGRLTALGAILFLALAGTCSAQPGSGFDGTWVFRVDGQNIFRLTLATKRGAITGSLTKPKGMTIDQEGDVTGVGPDPVTLPIQKSKLRPGQLDLMIDGDRLVITLADHDRVSLSFEGGRSWSIGRVSDGSAVVLASSLPEPNYTAEIRALREQLRAVVKEDQDARFAFDAARMEAADAKNIPEVLRIFNQYGWVTNSLAGKDAAHNFWLLVQHQTPEIQRRLLPALEKAAKAGDASMSDYAYLYDRVQVGLGKPQHWGSQSKCQNGKPVLESVDDPAGLDARRKELFMTVPELEAIRQLPLEERHAWRMASALRWGFADFDFARHEGVDRAVSTPARTGRSLVWSKADCRGSRRVP